MSQTTFSFLPAPTSSHTPLAEEEEQVLLGLIWKGDTNPTSWDLE